MKDEQRTACMDRELSIEAYHFQGLMQMFPNHFHEYYVLGFIESGRRKLFCQNEEYIVCSGDLVLFNPMDTHACMQAGEEPLDYRAINIKPEIMKRAVQEITGKEYLPSFSQTVILNSELVNLLRELHQTIMEKQVDFVKEELFLLLLEELLEKYVQNPKPKLLSENLAIEAVCVYIEEHYTERITLEELGKIAQMNKYSLVRNFAKIKGITPYCYLETIRVNVAKDLLEKYIEPIEVAIQTGFVDQSHFSNHFKKFIGLTPKQYQNIFMNKNN